MSQASLVTYISLCRYIAIKVEHTQRLVLTPFLIWCQKHWIATMNMWLTKGPNLHINKWMYFHWGISTNGCTSTEVYQQMDVLPLRYINKWMYFHWGILVSKVSNIQIVCQKSSTTLCTTDTQRNIMFVEMNHRTLRRVKA